MKRKGGCTEMFPLKRGVSGFWTHGPYFEYIIFSFLLPICFTCIKVLREVMMKHWWQGSKMKNSVDGSKNRYGKESTYLRHVFSCELFLVCFCLYWLNPLQTWVVYRRLFHLRNLVCNFWYSLKRNERSDFKYPVISVSLVSVLGKYWLWCC